MENQPAAAAQPRVTVSNSRLDPSYVCFEFYACTEQRIRSQHGEQYESPYSYIVRCRRLRYPEYDLKRKVETHCRHDTVYQKRNHVFRRKAKRLLKEHNEEDSRFIWTWEYAKAVDLRLRVIFKRYLNLQKVVFEEAAQIAIENAAASAAGIAAANGARQVRAGVQRHRQCHDDGGSTHNHQHAQAYAAESTSLGGPAQAGNLECAANQGTPMSNIPLAPSLPLPDQPATAQNLSGRHGGFSRTRGQVGQEGQLSGRQQGCACPRSTVDHPLSHQPNHGEAGCGDTASTVADSSFLRDYISETMSSSSSATSVYVFLKQRSSSYPQDRILIEAGNPIPTNPGLEKEILGLMVGADIVTTANEDRDA